MKYFHKFDPRNGGRLEIMDKDGVVDETLRPDLSDERIVELYRTMHFIRAGDDMAVNLQREGRMGTYAPVKGQEACQLAGAFLEQRDWLVPSYRETGALFARGVPLHMVYNYWMGDERGSAWDNELNVLPISIPVGSQPLYATGLAWAQKLQGLDSVVLVFLGDGATSEGEVHEAMNFAGVYNAPVVFFCQNNQFAISVPRRGQTGSETIAQKAYGYGFDGIQIYGNDLMAVYGAVNEAVETARRGEGPKFIEALTYRFGPHTTADDPTKYRDQAEVEKQLTYDPVTRVRSYLESNHLWDETKEKALTAEALAHAQRAAEEALAVPEPDPLDIFDYTYEKLPDHLSRQRAEFAAGLGKGGGNG